MAHVESWWWIFPLICLGMMLLRPFGRTRKGWRGRCFPFEYRSEDRERLQRLEEEIQNLKGQLACSESHAPYR